MTKAKGHKGNEPGAGWREVSIMGDNDETAWRLFVREQADPAWLNFKLVAVGSAPMKANYWFAFNRLTGRMAQARDFDLLRVHHPVLAQEVEKVTKDYC